MAPADSEHPDRDAAAEYVLGTLDAAERQAFEEQLANDAELAAEVETWKTRLSPLNEETNAVEPPHHLFSTILDRIGAGGGDNIIRLKRRFALWRGVAIAASALAASLILFIVIHGERTPAQNGFYMAVLQGSDKAPAFVAAIDMKSRMLVVRRMGAGAAEGHSYELWVLGADRTAPQSLGVIDAVAHIPARRMGALSANALDTMALAVSLEPPGGSPTGQPTGPVLFTGKLLPAD